MTVSGCRGRQSRDSPLLSLTSIVKDFSGTRALDGVDLELRCGTVHAVVGENGSGKSTLVRIIAGVLSRSAGIVRLAGEEVRFTTPADALRCGIGTVYQDVNLVSLLSVADNLGLGIERIRPNSSVRQFVDQCESVLRTLGAQFSLSAVIKDLSYFDKRLIQIARAIVLASRVLVLDEPTLGLSESECSALQRLIRSLCHKGVGTIYVSHRLQEVLDVADQISVLGDGRCVETISRARATQSSLIHLMIGKNLSNRGRPVAVHGTDSVLRVECLSDGRHFRDVSLDVREGEIVGLFGVPGSCETELLKAICGAASYERGCVMVRGQMCPQGSPRLAYGMGIVLLPADRRGEGLVLSASVRANIILPKAPNLCMLGVRRRRRETAVAQRFVDQFSIRTPGIETPVAHLSSGNQQKLLFARVIHAGAKIVLLDEPTQSVDIAGKVEIHTHIQQLASRGIAILVASSEVHELLYIAHRILVLRLGRVVGEFLTSEADAETILHLALP